MKRVIVDLTKCLACKSCELACALEHSGVEELFEAVQRGLKPKARRLVLNLSGKAMPLACQHCEEPLCVDACMTGALTKDPETGATVHDEDKCVGCWMCVMVCPFGAIRPGAEDKIAVKCDMCPDEEGFACVDACPTGALIVCDIEPVEAKGGE